MGEALDPPLCHRCPGCGAQGSEVIQPAIPGAYCHCPECGLMWHDARPTPRLAPKSDRRRPRAAEPDPPLDG